MSTQRPPRRALLSVHDKTGLEALGRGLSGLGYELVASGGTARALRKAGLPIVEVSNATGSPEILGGRVKTLHPVVHGGILATPTEAHEDELRDHGIPPVDVVVCNLYPFVETIRGGDATFADAIEQIDIGGVALLRAAAKNHARVTVLSDPAQYEGALAALEQDGGDGVLRRRLALAAFQHTAAYDAAIATWLGGEVGGEALPATLPLAPSRQALLRYGENPHQDGAFYGLPGATRWDQLQGKALSYNNLLDLDAAWQMPQAFSDPAVAIIKHSNPSGLAVAETLEAAYSAALACDPVSAFGSIITTNRPVGRAFVEGLGKLFVEVLAAPDFDEAALQWLGRKKKNCRVLRMHPGEAAPLQIRSALGGLLVQTPDRVVRGPETCRVVSARQPTDEELSALRFAWTACQFVKSNAILLAKGRATVGVGAGQMNRVDSVRLACWRAGDNARGSVLASDAFFPFADGIEAAVEAGVTAVIQPGGSIRDEEVIAAVDKLGVAMVLTGERHFRH
jgi:phosphoribosylaminoimidazolecarboxamide formyltransferase/IMP cyclohydrolase